MGAATDTYGYVGPAETTFETSTSGSRSLLDADGSRLAVKNGSTVAWLIFDLHGSVAALCPSGGSALSDAYRYDGYGQTVHTWSSGTAAANPWKYRGLLGISPGTTDLLYDMGARDYSPSLGTFTQFDSVQGGAANPATMNRYLYALANPATLVDPDGHFASEFDSVDAAGPAGGLSCKARGDAGCGRTAATSSSRITRPIPSSRVCDRGCERGDARTSSWVPPSADVWFGLTDQWRDWYTSAYWSEALAWDASGDTDESVIAYWILSSGLSGTSAGLRGDVSLETSVYEIVSPETFEHVFQRVNGGGSGAPWDIAIGMSFGAMLAGPKGGNRADFLVDERGTTLPTSTERLKGILQTPGAFEETSTSPTTSRKFEGVDHGAPIRVRIEKGHAPTPGWAGAIDPLHEEDHVHVDRRSNIKNGGQTGRWRSAWKTFTDWWRDVP